MPGINVLRRFAGEAQPVPKERVARFALGPATPKPQVLPFFSAQSHMVTPSPHRARQTDGLPGGCGRQQRISSLEARRDSPRREWLVRSKVGSGGRGLDGDTQCDGGGGSCTGRDLKSHQDERAGKAA